MILLNFEIDSDFITIRHDGLELDLHNNYKLTDFIYRITSKAAWFIFRKSDGDWVDKDLPESFKIVLKGVSAFYVHGDDPEYPIEYRNQDNKTVDMIGFSFNSDEIMDGVTSNISSSELPSLLIIFVTGRSMKVTAESAELNFAD